MQTENAYIETDLGNIALNPRGEYSDETSYEYLDTVSYMGGSYMCLAELTKNISGIAPESGENTQYWQMLTLPGQLTPGAIAMHDDIVNKSKQVETSRAAVELSQQAVEDAQVDVRQMRQDTQEASESAIASRDAAAGYAQAAEASRTAAAESEQNINAQVNNFNTHVSEKTSVAEASIEEARKKAIDAVTTQQDLSIKAVTDEETRQTNAAIKAVTTQQNNSVQAIADEASEQIKKIKDSLDKGLSEEGKAADAKATGDAISVLKEDTAVLQKRQNVLVGSEIGNPIAVDDAFAAPLCGLTVYGKSTQDGTPSPDNPVPIVSAGDGGTIAVTLSDGNGKTQTLILPTLIGLPGVPVASGGNYTDPQGQQWVCNEVNFESAMKVQRVTSVVFSDSSVFVEEQTSNGTRFKYTNKNLKKADKTTADSSAFCSALALGKPGSTWSVPDVFTIASMTLFVKFANINSLGELQQYLQQTPMSLTAILDTPIETPLTPAELTAYKALTTYAPNTVVQATDGAGLKLNYQRDVNIVIKNLEYAIASMTTT